MKHPQTCSKCGRGLEPPRGRPSRWCSEGCRRSGELEISRLQAVLRTFELGRASDRMNGMDVTTRDRAMAEVSSRLDRLCGVESKEEK